ncbi:signal transduction histidine kinase [Sphaerochaeta pleomorpha str. Grapes]|uniref:histidine kinase n=1 Tax=Sphaerochaeta pleomorpha (strain ATCC BAA-1885 / DSM 22778 / Grapes) TaxID=158190 RepID=G8QTD3_SPHPG|nr:HAMP domain-containing sensor histidine kinase [Sphaerochaeta pleomorpha]AEV30174.1 signal transduction histidine kinase [Sphaerochaeta pleomorpha str. Grapes]
MNNRKSLVSGLLMLELVGEHVVVILLTQIVSDATFALSFQLIYMTVRYTYSNRPLLFNLTTWLAGPFLFALFSSLPLPGALPILLLGSSTAFLARYRYPVARFFHLLPKKKTLPTKEAHELMLATLAHEIRTPLTIMQTTENVLLEEIPGPLNARQKKFMDSIFINTQRLIAFSENMLTLLKLERDWQPDLSKTIDLRNLIRQVVEIMEPMLASKTQYIKCSFPSLLSHPKADEAWIRQVLINLVHNASKHTDGQGSILISVTQDESQVVVTVTDNGHGLLGRQRETLFKEFYQEKQDMKEYQDGFGLGLTIVRMIIERHHGQVYITSSRQQGTMVSFSLPAKEMQ